MGRGALKLRGQNFLIDERVLDRIIETSGVKKGDCVLEIGPGLGFLTEKLLARGARVVAIELDAGFAEYLEKQFGEKIKVFCDDALKIDFQTLRSIFGGEKFKIVANIPYNITGELLEKIMVSDDVIESATLLVQKEVAERVVAKPPEMNRLALIIQAYAKPSLEFTVPAGAFLPPPKVTSAVLKMTLENWQTKHLVMRPAINLALKAFNAPRKKIRTTLKLGDDVFIVSGLTGDERPAELSIEKWLKLSKKQV